MTICYFQWKIRSMGSEFYKWTHRSRDTWSSRWPLITVMAGNMWQSLASAPCSTCMEPLVSGRHVTSVRSPCLGLELEPLLLSSPASLHSGLQAFQLCLWFSQRARFPPASKTHTPQSSSWEKSFPRCFLANIQKFPNLFSWNCFLQSGCLRTSSQLAADVRVAVV